MLRPLYQTLAVLVDAVSYCIDTGNTEWEGRHRDAIQELVREHLPHGSGFDGCTPIILDVARSDISAERQVLHFDVQYHYMNEHGYYNGWRYFVVKVRPDLLFGVTLVVAPEGCHDDEILEDDSGWDALCEYIAECFEDRLRLMV